MTARVLHILSQRPLLTGSGITLDAFVRIGERKGWDQHVIVGTPGNDEFPEVADLPRDRIHPLYFGDGDLAFPVPGMSDVMPYPSTRFSEMTPPQLVAYKKAWSEHIGQVASFVQPSLIHSHHIWIMSSLIKKSLPQIPLVTQCHSTGLRQMVLCPELKNDVVEGCKKIDRFLVLREDHRDKLSGVLGREREDIHLVGSGYNDSVFHPRGRSGKRARLIYVGKLSAAKGLPWLLDAVEQLSTEIPKLELHIVGAGAGNEAESIEQRIRALPGIVKYWGQLPQTALADLFRTASVCVLPSFYEGVPLVLVEALASGCRVLSTRLEGVVNELEPHLGDALGTIPLPRLRGLDSIHPSAEHEFVESLKAAIKQTLEKPPVDVADATFAEALTPFSWSSVFERVETVWKRLARLDLRPKASPESRRNSTHLKT